MGGYTGEMLQKLRSPALGQRSGFGVEIKQRVFGGIGLCVTVGFAYFLAAQLGLALRTAEEQVAVFWPASGIAIGVLVALGRRAFIPVAVAVMAASVATALLGDRYLWRALAFGFCNAVEALMAMWLIERWFGAAFNLDSLHRVVGFFAAVTVATATAAVGAAAAMTFFGPASASFQDVWEVWFASDALGTITVAPLLIGIAAAARDPPPWRELLGGTFAVVVVTRSPREECACDSQCSHVAYAGCEFLGRRLCIRARWPYSIHGSNAPAIEQQQMERNSTVRSRRS